MIKSPRAGHLGELRSEVTSYEHEVAAFGGYYSARFDLTGSMVDVDDWFEHGLGRHVEVHDPDLEIAFEGFVNQVGINVGQYAAMRGPLVEVANRVYVVYSERDTATDPPTVIPGMITIISQDTGSQAKWGIWEQAVSGGETDADGAEYYRDQFLIENAEPFTDDPRVALEAGGQISVSVECLGYWAWLLAYPYQDTNSGTVTCTAKVQNILQADTNAIFPADYSHVGSNLALAPAYEDSGTPAWNVMKALTAQGDINNDRWTFGVYEGRKVHYQKVPEEIAYQHRLADPSQPIETVIGGEVRPWKVRPARWLFLPDLLTGREQPSPATDWRGDPRFVFVESVRYRAPYTVEITGTRVGRLAQIQAKQGLGGR